MIKRVMLVDDEDSLRAAVGTYLGRVGYEVVHAGSGEEAVQVLKRQKIAGVLLDIGLPDQSGIDLVPRLLAVEPTLAIVMLTGIADVSTAALCMQRGAFDYLAKPIELTELAGALGRALERRERELVEHRSIDLLKDEVARLAVEAHRQQMRFDKLSVATLESLVYLMEAKSSYLAGHSVRVAQLAASIASQQGRNDEDVETVRLAARLHDIGMICIGDEVLSKQGRLTDAEFDQIKRHSIVGAQILGPMHNLTLVSAFVRGHHEHWDGKGYPDGLAGNAIPWGARVIGAAEVLDALTSSRPYQERMQPDEAVEHMRGLVGTTTGPEEFEAVAAVARRRHALVFIEDEAEQAYPPGIAGETLAGGQHDRRHPSGRVHPDRRR